MRAARLWATGSGIEVAASAKASSRCRTQSARWSSSRTRNDSDVGVGPAAVAAGELRVRDMVLSFGKREGASTERRDAPGDASWTTWVSALPGATGADCGAA